MKPIDLLHKDYESTNDYIYKCDEHMFKIKNWALVTTTAIIAYSISNDKNLIVLVNLLLIPAFMYLELIYKSFQDTAIEHSTDLSIRIDNYINNTDCSELLNGFQFGFGRKLKYPSISQIVKILTNKYRRHIINFYLLLALFSIGALIIGW